MKENKQKRISVYIDGANFYYGLKTINERYSDIYFDSEKILTLFGFSGPEKP